MNQDRLTKIALIAAPWPIYNRPSIQLGTLKAYLNQAVPDLTVDAFHLYLRVADRVGYPHYTAVSERTWLAESVFAALLYPEKSTEARVVFEREARRHQQARRIDFDQLVQTAGRAVDRFIAGIEWEAYLLAGFTISLCQLTASLYLAREIKHRCPTLKIVAGGSSVAAPSGQAIVQHFEWIDAVVQGEGEEPLVKLINNLRSGLDISTAGSEAILVAGDTRPPESVAFDQLDTLAALPVPDYDAYFNELHQLAPENRFFPVLPAEISRGCWWQKRSPQGSRGCAFCNLNTQWRGYRAKDPAQITAELEHLKNRHQLLNFAFMDNALPVKTTRAIFDALAAIGHDFSLFGEIRATTAPDTLAAMRRAGLDQVQIGIEALSARLLDKLNKGTTAIDNIEAMRHCEELGIENRSNLIVQFPGSDETDVAQTLQAIEFAQIYRPLKPVPFWLGLGSPVCRDFGRYGIRTHFNHPNYRSLFPRDLTRKVPLVIQTYRGDRTQQKKLWAPVVQRVRRWEATYTALHRRYPAQPILSYQDGGNFIILRQRRPHGPAHTHRLTGSSRDIYLFCRQARTRDAVVAQHAKFSALQIRGFLDEMVQKRLMFSENGRYLSLAVRMSSSRGGN